MRIQLGMVAAVASLIGCGADKADTSQRVSDGPCSSPKGSFTLTLTERSGTCGPVPEQVVVLPSPDAAECVVLADDTSPNGCESDGQQRCALDNGFVETDRGHIEIMADGSVRGTLQILIQDSVGNTRCSSTYDAKWAKI